MTDYADQTLRIADLALETDGLQNKSFERCVIAGPAVIVPVGSTFVGCSFEGDPQALIWDIPPERERLLGAIRLESCSFTECQFTRVGLGLAKDAAAEFLEALQATAAAQQQEPVAH